MNETRYCPDTNESIPVGVCIRSQVCFPQTCCGCEYADIVTHGHFTICPACGGLIVDRFCGHCGKEKQK